MSGVSWGLLTPDQLKTGMNQLLADAQGTDIAVKACTELDATAVGSWNVFFDVVRKFCAQNPVWFFPLASNDVLTTRGLALQWENYEQELISWKTLLGKTCSTIAATPSVDLTPKIDPTTTQITNTIKYVSIAVIFVAGVYLAGEIAVRIPRRA